MPYFQDMADAVAQYPVSSVRLEIIDVEYPGDAVNVMEEGNFRVQVKNVGQLNMTWVTLRIEGQNGATVKNNGAAATFGSDFVTQELPPINAHSSQVTTGGVFNFKAPAAAQASMTLVKATLEAWDVNLDHILNGHSDPLDDLPAGTYAAEVVVS